MSERKKDIIFFGIGIPLLLGLIVYDEVVGVMFAVGVCLGSLIEKFGWNDRNCQMKKFKKIKVGDRVKTKWSGIGTVLEVGCYNSTMIKLKCDKPKWSCPYFYESELDLEYGE